MENMEIVLLVYHILPNTGKGVPAKSDLIFEGLAEVLSFPTVVSG